MKKGGGGKDTVLDGQRPRKKNAARQRLKAALKPAMIVRTALGVSVSANKHIGTMFTDLKAWLERSTAEEPSAVVIDEASLSLLSDKQRADIDKILRASPNISQKRLDQLARRVHR